MPEAALQETSIAYSDEFLIDRPPREQPNSGAGNLENILQSWRLVTKPMRFLAEDQEHAEFFITGWPEKKDPFTQADLLNDEEKKVQELIFRTRTSISIPYRESLANRLLTLFNDAKEEDPASCGIAVESLRNFYSFLRSHTNLKCPIISLTPDNNIYASWRGEQNRVFSVHFLTSGDVHFVIFKPNYMHPERQIRISGTATADTLMETVTRDGLWDWIAE